MEPTQAKEPEATSPTFTYLEKNAVDTTVPETPADKVEYFDLNPEAGIVAEETGSETPAGVSPEEEGGDKPTGEPKGEEEKKPTPEQYWQSRADKFSSGLNKVLSTLGMEPVDTDNSDALQARLEDLQKVQTLIPIARYIEQNPTILNDVEKSLSNGQPVGEPAAKPQDQQESLKPPVKPTKPNDYNLEDALDPDSSTFKYNQAMQQYSIDLAEYNNQVIGQQNQRVQQEAMERQQRMQVQSVNSQLINAHKYSEDQVVDFWKTMDYLNNEATIDDLVLFHKLRSLPRGEALERLQKAEQLRSRQQKLQTPTPIGVQGGENPKELTDEEKFNESLLAFRRR